MLRYHVRSLLRTLHDPALALVRIVLGIVFFAHGAQKVLGWFGGAGFSATMSAFTERMGIPAIFAFLAICARIPRLTRVAAFGIAVNMAVDIIKVHRQNGLFMNWQGSQHGEGYEYHLLVLAMSVLLMVRGTGAGSLDYALSSSRTLPAAR
jgi:putative oxidoreductase